MSKEEREMEFTAYVREGGRVTIPKGVRAALNIKKGDLVGCRIRKIK